MDPCTTAALPPAGAEAHDLIHVAHAERAEAGCHRFADGHRAGAPFAFVRDMGGYAQGEQKAEEGEGDAHGDEQVQRQQLFAYG